MSVLQPPTKETEHALAQQSLERIQRLHQTEFPPAVRPCAPEAQLPQFAQVLAEAERQRLHGVSLLHWKARQQARAEARQLAEDWALRLMDRARADRAQRQRELDMAWAEVQANAEVAVVTAVTTAFASVTAPARIKGVLGGFALIEVATPTDGEVPTLKPALTGSGAPSTGKLNKTERAALERQLVGARMLLAVKQTLAAAPGLLGVHAVAVRTIGLPGDESREPLVAASVHRGMLVAAPHPEDAWTTLEKSAAELHFEIKGRIRALQPIDLEPHATFAGMINEAQGEA